MSGEAINTKFATQQFKVRGCHYFVQYVMEGHFVAVVVSGNISFLNIFCVYFILAGFEPRSPDPVAVAKEQLNFKK
jgi:hypothetical protein